MKSKIDSDSVKHDRERIVQGDILKDFKYKDDVFFEDKKIKIKQRTIPYLVVLTQDCDLEQDYDNHKNKSDKQDKFLPSVLVCPAYPASTLREGTHLLELEQNMEKIDSSRWGAVKKNQNSRYHFIKGKKEFQIPELVIDFKHYYTIPRDGLYKEHRSHYIGTINELFRECLSQRFAFYLSRIGLPFIKNEGSEDTAQPRNE